MIKLGLFLETSQAPCLCPSRKQLLAKAGTAFHSLVILPQMAGNPEVVGFHDVHKPSVRTLETFVCILFLSCVSPGLSAPLQLLQEVIHFLGELAGVKN